MMCHLPGCPLKAGALLVESLSTCPPSPSCAAETFKQSTDKSLQVTPWLRLNLIFTYMHHKKYCDPCLMIKFSLKTHGFVYKTGGEGGLLFTPVLLLWRQKTGPSKTRLPSLLSSYLTTLPSLFQSPIHAIREKGQNEDREGEKSGSHSIITVAKGMSECP